MAVKIIIATTGTVYLLYLIFGGFLFTLLDEFGTLDMIIREKSNPPAVFTDMKIVLLENFSKNQIQETIKEWKRELTEFYFSNETVELTDIDWTYANSFFFAFKLCSTVGHGNIFPRTSYGQILAVFYTSVGVPLHITLLVMLEESFAQSYQKLKKRVNGHQDSTLSKILSSLLFFGPWIFLFYLIPAAAFIFMENWSFIDGLYCTFITLTTIGEGDYIAGSKVVSKIAYSVYKLLLFLWMLYGLAFTEMIVNFMTHLYQMYLLFSFECSCRKCKCKFERQYVDVEKMDIHFKLIRAEAVKPEYSLWSFPETIRQGVGFRTKNMFMLSECCEKIKLEILFLLRLHISSSTEVITAKSMKAVYKNIPKDKYVCNLRTIPL